jgi:erythromycin esterase
MTRRSVVLAAAVAVVLTVPVAARADGKELLPGIYRFNGLAPSQAPDDLEPMKAVVGDATVVALGESIHTSGGYSHLKFRLFRFLVEEMGFRAYAFESPWERAESVAEYVRTCEGTADEALYGLFGVWQNTSVRGIVEWMCTWNRRHADDPVYFLGFDEQQPDLDYAALREHLRRFRLPDDDVRIVGIDENCSKAPIYRRLATSAFEACVSRLDQLARYFDRRQANLVRRTSAEELEWARLRLLGLRAWQFQLYYLDADPTTAVAARDEAMARIFLKRRELQLPDVKTVIWAHNFHINEKGAASFGAPTMGDYLAAALGEDYVTFALVGYQVEIDWPGVGCGLRPLPVGSSNVEVLLHDLGEPYLFVDLDFPATADPFLEPGRRYRLSAELLVPRDHYDAVFFLERSAKMDPLRWPSCQ